MWCSPATRLLEGPLACGAEARPHCPPHAFPALRLNPVPNISIWFLNSSKLKAPFSPHRGAWRTRCGPQGTEMSLGGSGAQGEEPSDPVNTAIQSRCGGRSAWIPRFGVQTNLTASGGAGSWQRKGEVRASDPDPKDPGPPRASPARPKAPTQKKGLKIARRDPGNRKEHFFNV